MNRKKAIKKYNKVRKVIEKVVEPILSLADSSEEIFNIISQLKTTKKNKKIIKGIIENCVNIRVSSGKLATNTNKLFKKYDLLGIILFHYPYFP